jgi:hypothetical protein
LAGATVRHILESADADARRSAEFSGILVISIKFSPVRSSQVADAWEAFGALCFVRPENVFAGMRLFG